MIYFRENSNKSDRIGEQLSVTTVIFVTNGNKSIYDLLFIKNPYNVV